MDAPTITKLDLIAVDHSADLKESIRRCQLDHVQPEIFSFLNQLKTGKRDIEKAEIFTAHFNRPIGLLQIITELSYLVTEFSPFGFRGTNFREQLEVGFRHRCLQCEFPLVAVGAGCKNGAGDYGVPYLGYSRKSGDRTLLLNWVAGYEDRKEREFKPFCRFLAVPKPKEEKQ